MNRHASQVRHGDSNPEEESGRLGVLFSEGLGSQLRSTSSTITPSSGASPDTLKGGAKAATSLQAKERRTEKSIDATEAVSESEATTPHTAEDQTMAGTNTLDSDPLMPGDQYDDEEGALVEGSVAGPAVDEPIEVDFYNEPTILSRLILNQKYGGALHRVHHKPQEASIWVAAKRMPTKSEKRRMAGNRSQGEHSDQHTSSDEPIYSIRQLPIHLACLNLRRTADASRMAKLNELITSLIVAFPEGASEADHLGRLPMHEALWYGASPETLSMFLMASPPSIHSVDLKGRTLTELNQYRSGDNKQEVQDILDMGQDFWDQAHREAAIRVKKEVLPWPSADVSLGSDSVLASSEQDKESIATKDVLPDDLEASSDGEGGSHKEITPVAWDQLEQRAVALEHVLTEMNEKNYELNRRIETITKGKMELLDQINHLRGSTLAREVNDLQHENTVLNARLANLQNLVHGSVAGDDESSVGAFSLGDLTSIASQLTGETLNHRQEALVRLSNELMTKYDALYEKHLQQKQTIKRLRYIVRTVVNKDTASVFSDDAESSAAVSQLTGLTGTDFESEVSGSRHPRRQKSYRTNVVVDWTPLDSDARDGKPDSLDGIVRKTAVRARKSTFANEGGSISNSIKSVWVGPLPLAGGDIDTMSVVVRDLANDDASTIRNNADNLSTIFRAASGKEVRHEVDYFEEYDEEEEELIQSFEYEEIQILGLHIEDRSNTPVHLVGMERCGFLNEGPRDADST